MRQALLSQVLMSHRMPCCGAEPRNTMGPQVHGCRGAKGWAHRQGADRAEASGRTRWGPAEPRDASPGRWAARGPQARVIVGLKPARGAEPRGVKAASAWDRGECPRRKRPELPAPRRSRRGAAAIGGGQGVRREDREGADPYDRDSLNALS